MKLIKFVAMGLLLALGTPYVLGLLQDSRVLETDMVRLHVVANSDTDQDQAEKLQVRDGITELLNQVMEQLPSAEEAKTWLLDNLDTLQEKANAVLRQLGSTHTATVSLEQEAFPTREYDTFRLPAGIYEALRVTIGEGQGQNWWCVVFPSLCIPASSRGFQQQAEENGMSRELSQTLTEDSGAYEIRFRLLDWIGEVKIWLAGLG